MPKMPPSLINKMSALKNAIPADEHKQVFKNPDDMEAGFIKGVDIGKLEKESTERIKNAELKGNELFQGLIANGGISFDGRVDWEELEGLLEKNFGPESNNEIIEEQMEVFKAKKASVTEQDQNRKDTLEFALGEGKGALKDMLKNIAEKSGSKDKLVADLLEVWDPEVENEDEEAKERRDKIKESRKAVVTELVERALKDKEKADKREALVTKLVDEVLQGKPLLTVLETVLEGDTSTFDVSDVLILQQCRNGLTARQDMHVQIAESRANVEKIPDPYEKMVCTRYLDDLERSWGLQVPTPIEKQMMSVLEGEALPGELESNRNALKKNVETSILTAKKSASEDAVVLLEQLQESMNKDEPDNKAFLETVERLQQSYPTVMTHFVHEAREWGMAGLLLDAKTDTDEAKLEARSEALFQRLRLSGSNFDRMSVIKACIKKNAKDGRELLTQALSIRPGESMVDQEAKLIVINQVLVSLDAAKETEAIVALQEAVLDPAILCLARTSQRLDHVTTNTVWESVKKIVGLRLDGKLKECLSSKDKSLKLLKTLQDKKVSFDTVTQFKRFAEAFFYKKSLQLDWKIKDSSEEDVDEMSPTGKSKTEKSKTGKGKAGKSKKGKGKAGQDVNLKDGQEVIDAIVVGSDGKINTDKWEAFTDETNVFDSEVDKRKYQAVIKKLSEIDKKRFQKAWNEGFIVSRLIITESKVALVTLLKELQREKSYLEIEDELQGMINAVGRRNIDAFKVIVQRHKYQHQMKNIGTDYKDKTLDMSFKDFDQSQELGKIHSFNLTELRLPEGWRDEVGTKELFLQTQLTQVQESSGESIQELEDLLVSLGRIENENKNNDDFKQLKNSIETVSNNYMKTVIARVTSPEYLKARREHNTGNYLKDWEVLAENPVTRDSIGVVIGIALDRAEQTDPEFFEILQEDLTLQDGKFLNLDLPVIKKSTETETKEFSNEFKVLKTPQKKVQVLDLSFRKEPKNLKANLKKLTSVEVTKLQLTVQHESDAFLNKRDQQSLLAMLSEVQLYVLDTDERHVGRLKKAAGVFNQQLKQGDADSKLREPLKAIQIELRALNERHNLEQAGEALFKKATGDFEDNQIGDRLEDIVALMEQAGQKLGATVSLLEPIQKLKDALEIMALLGRGGVDPKQGRKIVYSYMKGKNERKLADLLELCQVPQQRLKQLRVDLSVIDTLKEGNAYKTAIQGESLFRDVGINKQTLKKSLERFGGDFNFVLRLNGVSVKEDLNKDQEENLQNIKDIKDQYKAYLMDQTKRKFDKFQDSLKGFLVDADETIADETINEDHLKSLLFLQDVGVDLVNALCRNDTDFKANLITLMKKTTDEFLFLKGRVMEVPSVKAGCLDLFLDPKKRKGMTLEQQLLALDWCRYQDPELKRIETADLRVLVESLGKSDQVVSEACFRELSPETFQALAKRVPTAAITCVQRVLARNNPDVQDKVRALVTGVVDRWPDSRDQKRVLTMVLGPDLNAGESAQRQVYLETLFGGPKGVGEAFGLSARRAVLTKDEKKDYAAIPVLVAPVLVTDMTRAAKSVVDKVRQRQINDDMTLVEIGRLQQQVRRFSAAELRAGNASYETDNFGDTNKKGFEPVTVAHFCHLGMTQSEAQDCIKSLKKRKVLSKDFRISKERFNVAALSPLERQVLENPVMRRVVTALSSKPPKRAALVTLEILNENTDDEERMMGLIAWVEGNLTGDVEEGLEKFQAETAEERQLLRMIQRQFIQGKLNDELTTGEVSAALEHRLFASSNSADDALMAIERLLSRTKKQADKETMIKALMMPGPSRTSSRLQALMTQSLLPSKHKSAIFKEVLAFVNKSPVGTLKKKLLRKQETSFDVKWQAASFLCENKDLVLSETRMSEQEFYQVLDKGFSLEALVKNQASSAIVKEVFKAGLHTGKFDRDYLRQDYERLKAVVSSYIERLSTGNDYDTEVMESCLLAFKQQYPLDYEVPNKYMGSTPISKKLSTLMVLDLEKNKGELFRRLMMQTPEKSQSLKSFCTKSVLHEYAHELRYEHRKQDTLIDFLKELYHRVHSDPDIKEKEKDKFSEGFQQLIQQASAQFQEGVKGISDMHIQKLKACQYQSFDSPKMSQNLFHVVMGEEFVKEHGQAYRNGMYRRLGELGIISSDGSITDKFPKNVLSSYSYDDSKKIFDRLKEFKSGELFRATSCKSKKCLDEKGRVRFCYESVVDQLKLIDGVDGPLIDENADAIIECMGGSEKSLKALQEKDGFKHAKVLDLKSIFSVEFVYNELEAYEADEAVLNETYEHEMALLASDLDMSPEHCRPVLAVLKSLGVLVDGVIVGGNLEEILTQHSVAALAVKKSGKDEKEWIEKLTGLQRYSKTVSAALKDVIRSEGAVLTDVAFDEISSKKKAPPSFFLEPRLGKTPGLRRQVLNELVSQMGTPSPTMMRNLRYWVQHTLKTKDREGLLADAQLSDEARQLVLTAFFEKSDGTVDLTSDRSTILLKTLRDKYTSQNGGFILPLEKTWVMLHGLVHKRVIETGLKDAALREWGKVEKPDSDIFSALKAVEAEDIHAFRKTLVDLNFKRTDEECAETFLQCLVDSKSTVSPMDRIRVLEVMETDGRLPKGTIQRVLKGMDTLLQGRAIPLELMKRFADADNKEQGVLMEHTVRRLKALNAKHPGRFGISEDTFSLAGLGGKMGRYIEVQERKREGVGQLSKKELEKLTALRQSILDSYTAGQDLSSVFLEFYNLIDKSKITWEDFDKDSEKKGSPTVPSSGSPPSSGPDDAHLDQTYENLLLDYGGLFPEVNITLKRDAFKAASNDQDKIKLIAAFNKEKEELIDGFREDPDLKLDEITAPVLYEFIPEDFRNKEKGSYNMDEVKQKYQKLCASGVEPSMARDVLLAITGIEPVVSSDKLTKSKSKLELDSRIADSIFVGKTDGDIIKMIKSEFEVSLYINDDKINEKINEIRGVYGISETPDSKIKSETPKSKITLSDYECIKNNGVGLRSLAAGGIFEKSHDVGGGSLLCGFIAIAGGMGQSENLTKVYDDLEFTKQERGMLDDLKRVNIDRFQRYVGYRLHRWYEQNPDEILGVILENYHAELIEAGANRIDADNLVAIERKELRQSRNINRQVLDIVLQRFGFGFQLISANAVGVEQRDDAPNGVVRVVYRPGHYEAVKR